MFQIYITVIKIWCTSLPFAVYQIPENIVVVNFFKMISSCKVLLTSKTYFIAYIPL